MSVFFADSSYLIALEAANDQSHQSALRHWASLDMASIELVVTSFIFDEIVTFLNSKGMHSKAVQLGNSLLRSSHIQFVQVEMSLLTESWSYLQQHRDKDYSLTDCISFVVMKQRDITTALTFDHHFTQAGFLAEP